VSPAACLFDLDDTLFDLRHSSRTALAAVQARHPVLRDASLDQLEWDYRQLLDEMHAQFVRGVYTLQDARVLRWQRFFAAYGRTVSEAEARGASAFYHEIYDSTQRAVPGAAELLQALKPRVKIGVATNNPRIPQLAKLERCGLAHYVDMLVSYEEVGAPKPEPPIYLEALKRLDCHPAEAVMIGDHWEWDVLGAMRVGMRAVWFNRFGVTCPDPSLAPQIRALEPLAEVLQVIGIE
jgi:HAD superfamily hydrolase (TIGR01509 family)